MRLYPVTYWECHEECTVKVFSSIDRAQDAAETYNRDKENERKKNRALMMEPCDLNDGRL